MIEKMKFLSITGPKADIDRVVNTYLSKYEIHLENALSELTTVQNLTPFLEINPYKEALNTANLFCEELNSFAADTVKAETALAASFRQWMWRQHWILSAAFRQTTRIWTKSGLIWRIS